MVKTRFLAVLAPLIFVATMALSGCSSTEARQEKAQLHLRIGTSYLTKGHYPQALSELTEAEALDGENPIIQNNLGLSYFVRKQYDQAETHIGKAIQLDPKYTDAKNNLARVYIELTRYDEAIRLLNEVVKDLTYTTPEKAFVNLGLAYMKKGEYNSALDAFKKSLDSNNRFCPGYNYYGQAQFQMQKYEAAIDSFETALRLCNNNYDEPEYFSALSYYKAGKPEKAQAQFEAVVKKYPDSEYATKAKAMLKIVR